MKKKRILIGMILLALVLTSGTFAYTYSGFAATTLDVVLAGESITTQELSDDQPNWDSVLPEGEFASEILIPNATGDDTELPTQFPDSGEHWDKVDDPEPDDISTYVSTLGSRHWERDLYNLTNHAESEGEIEIINVTVYYRCAAGGSYDIQVMGAIKTYDTVYEGPTVTHSGASFVTRSYQLTKNPVTNQPWTWEEINDLQAGVTIRGSGKDNPALCTQVYVAVNYEFTLTEGEVPEGELYDITPHPGYTGDLLVKIYLTNTANILKAYKYLNMKVYVDDSLEAEKTPRYQILSIETGVVMFNIEGGSAESYTVEILGGGYRLLTADPEEWGEGWSVEPEFYCEVTQR